MIAPNPNLLCKQAEPYYYDLLCDEGSALIPESIVNHIEQCQQCREQINRLKAALLQADSPESEQGQVRSAVTTMLKLHFDYIGEPVTCNIAKPFLPCLLDPALEIRIPTPIITHLHNCQQCSEDLDVIRSLKLNRKQLCRLSQLFAEKPLEDRSSCSQTRAAILAVVLMAFRETNAEVLRHLCICPDCRKALYQYRETTRGEYLRYGREQEKFPCEEVSAADIFDYVVPYGIDPANDQYAKFRKSLTSHVITCPTCLARMQTLHETIYHIAERPNSDVVTIYHIDESAKTEARSESDDIYAGFPIRVEIANHGDEVNTGPSASTIGLGLTLKQKVSAMRLKPLAKTAVAAAAVVLIAVALFLSTQTARAVTIDQIYKALVKVKNVHISRFADKKELIQEKWVSRALNIYMTKTGKQLVLSDIPNGVRKIKELDIALTETRPLTNDDIADIEKKISGSLGLMPFYDISKKVPPDSKLSRVTDGGLEGVSEGIEVHDLIWTEKTRGGSVLFRKWRVFANAETNRPERVEWYKKLAADDEFVLETIIEVKYLSDSKIQTVIKDVGF